MNRPFFRSFVFLLLCLLGSAQSWALDGRLVGTWKTYSGDVLNKFTLNPDGTGTYTQTGDPSFPSAVSTTYFKWSTDSGNTAFTQTNTRVKLSGAGSFNYDRSDTTTSANYYTIGGTNSDTWTMGSIVYTRYTDYTVSTLVTATQFKSLSVNALTADPSGNVYAAIPDGSLRKITPAGVISTPNIVDSNGNPVLFKNPGGIAIDPDGNLFVSNTENATIDKVTPEGVAVHYIGVSNDKGFTDGSSAVARLFVPKQLFLDSNGTLFVADFGYFRKIDSSGTVSTLVNGDSFTALDSFVVDSLGNIFFTRTNTPTVINKIDSTGATTVFAGNTTVGGTVDGTGIAANFVGPLRLAIDANNTIFVADKGDLTLRKVTSTGIVKTIAGLTKATAGSGSSVDGAGTVARFVLPGEFALNSIGDLFVVDSGSIRKAVPPRVSQTITFAAIANRYVSSDALALTGSSSSGLTLTYSIVSGPATVQGNIVSLTGNVGTVRISASQPGNDSFLPATAVERSFQVALDPPKAQTITFAQPSALTYGDEPILLSGTASSGLPVTLSCVSNAGTLIGNSLTITGAGKIVITAKQPGNSVYAAATPVTRTVTVAKKTLTVSISDASRLVGQPNPKSEDLLSYSGFIGSENVSDLKIRPVVSFKATAASAQGSYVLSFTGGSDENYQFVLSSIPSTLTVVGYGGSYESLLLDNDQNPVGKLELTVATNSLAYSGRLTLRNESKPITLAGKLTPAENLLSASGAFHRLKTGSLEKLDLAFAISTDGSFEGDSSNQTSHLMRADEPFANLANGTRLYTPAKTSALWAGAHTVTFNTATPLTPGDVRSSPQGFGFATASIAPTTGILTLAGKLADGTLLNATLKPAPDGSYILWTSPYTGRLESFLAGRLALQTHPDADKFPNRFYVSSSEGSLVWEKAALAPTAKLEASYREGFGPLSLPVSLDPWLPPAAATKNSAAVTLVQRLALSGTNLVSGSFNITYGPSDLDLGEKSDALPQTASLSVKNVVSVLTPVTTPLNSTNWKVTFTPTTGLFSGSFTLSDLVAPATKPTPRAVSFFGILRQPPSDEPGASFGSGFFMLPPLSGSEQVSGQIQFTAQ